MISRKPLNLNDPDDVAKIHQILFDSIDKDGEIQPGTSSHDIEEEERDADASEEIENGRKTEIQKSNIHVMKTKRGFIHLLPEAGGKGYKIIFLGKNFFQLSEKNYEK